MYSLRCSAKNVKSGERRTEKNNLICFTDREKKWLKMAVNKINLLMPWGKMRTGGKIFSGYNPTDLLYLKRVHQKWTFFYSRVFLRNIDIYPRNCSQGFGFAVFILISIQRRTTRSQHLWFSVMIGTFHFFLSFFFLNQ